MAERTSRLRLVIDSSDARTAARDLDKFGDQADRAGREARQLGTKTDQAGRKMRGLGSAASSAAVRVASVGSALLTAGAAVATFGAIRFAAGFERQMDSVLAVSGATNAQFKALNETARELGATTIFSAKQAAEGMEFLARAGFDADQIISALPGTLDLAAAGALELGRASQIAANTLKGFGLGADEIDRVSDVLAKAAASSNTTVNSLGEALKFAAPNARALGLSLEETVAAIGKLGDTGLAGGLGGRGFQSFTTGLVRNQEKIEKIIGEFDLQAEGLESVLRRLADANIDNATVIELFNAENLDVFTTLAESATAAENSLGDLNEELENAQGFARKTAETMQDNLLGALKEATSAFSELQIIVGTSGGLEGFTALVRQLTELLKSDAARNFAESVGEALGETSLAAAGLLDLLKQINELSPGGGSADENNARRFIPTPLNGGLIGVAAEAGIIPEAANVFDLSKALEKLSDRGGVATENIEVTARATKELNKALGDADLAAAMFERELAAIGGDDTGLGATLRIFDDMMGALVELSRQANATAEEVSGIGEAGDDVAAATAAIFQQDVARSEALRDAASRSLEEYRDLVREFNIQDEIQNVVDALSKAGTPFDLKIVESSVRKIFDNEEATEALVEAAENAADAFADGVEAAADQFNQQIAANANFNDVASQSALNLSGGNFNKEELQGLIDDRQELIRAIERVAGDERRFATEAEQREIDSLEAEQEGIRRAIKAGAEEGAFQGITTGLSASISAGLDRFIFGGDSFQDIFSDFARGAVNDNVFDPISEALTGNGNIFSNIEDAFRGQVEGFQKAFGEIGGALAGVVSGGFQGFELGKGISGAFGIEGNPASTLAGGGIGTVAGGIAGALLGGPVGAAIGSAIGSAIGTIVGGLFSKPSDFVGQVAFDPSTGDVLGTGQDGNSQAAQENFAAANEFASTLSSITVALEELTGASIDRLFNVAVGSRDGVRIQFQDQPANAALRFDANERGLQEAFDEAIRLLVGELQGGTEALVNYAQAAAQAGRDGESIVTGLETLAAVLSLNEEPLSNIEQALKSIDDAVNPVIEDLKALGLSLTELQSAAAEAARAVGVSFIRQIEDDILGFRNAALGEFKRILDAQADLVSDANLLLDRGAITPAEFDLVQVRNALERESFFEGLSPEDLEGLGDFFGLIEDSGGSVAVVLTQLTDAFSDFTDNVSETRDRLQEEADQLRSFADQIFRTRDQIDLRFPSQSGGDLLAALRGELAGLRESALAGDNTAFEEVPEIANRLVNLAREIFGSTENFAEERDFALGILDQTGSLAESRANKLLSEIEALNTQVDVLNDIRDVLESPDPSIEFLQAQLSQGAVTNDLIAQLLSQYIALTQEARAGALSPAEAQAASEAFLSVGGTPQTGGSVSIERFDENITLLAQIRDEIRKGNLSTETQLQNIRNEQRRSGTNATLTAA